ncbi:MAG: NAD(P)H-dependent glycerol-3-phosphate dehydrogenase [Bacteroidota bacterium]|jgi:glycerol-3-phosphate dehydrogenase (NAD(P)+)
MARSELKIGVLGSGSWATAIVKILTTNTQPIYWWIREDEIAESVTQTGVNTQYLSSTKIDTKKIKVYTDIKKVIEKSDYIILVIPAAFIHHSLQNIQPAMLANKKIISAVKGIVPEKMEIVADYLMSEFKISINNIGIISGPSHAEEIALEKLTYLTSASQNKDLAESVANIFRCNYVKASTSDDIFGTEYAAVLKNIYALGCGIYKGLGYGDNFMAAFIANCAKEMKHFIGTIHPIDRTLYDSVYLGDLLVTAYSQFSRNRTFGNMIGQGYSVATVQLEMNMVAEGYYATRCIHEINKNYGASIPIIETIYNILYQGKPQALELKKLCDILV